MREVVNLSSAVCSHEYETAEFRLSRILSLVITRFPFGTPACRFSLGDRQCLPKDLEIISFTPFKPELQHEFAKAKTRDSKKGG
mmetsp:Transcript_6205/g.7131  ORF Transcript_6205/g.7131 Transcript_6205/m.7131 type:complete len:84 (+) Transcript_6205:1062-1313(+)